MPCGLIDWIVVRREGKRLWKAIGVDVDPIEARGGSKWQAIGNLVNALQRRDPPFAAKLLANSVVIDEVPAAPAARAARAR